VTRPVRVLVGGVGELWQGDLDLGRVAAERLATEDLGPGVAVEELHYGAVAVAQRLEELDPEALVLVTAIARGRRPGAVERRRVAGLAPPPEQVQVGIGQAVTGYVDVDLLLLVAAGLGALPDRTVVVEVEPAETGLSTELSARAAAGLEQALALVRSEVRRLPLLGLADELRAALADGHVEPSPALDALHGLLQALDGLDRDGRWGAAFRYRNRLRLAVAEGTAGDGMGTEDWALWWTLVEELDRLEAVEAVEPDRLPPSRGLAAP
jgi:hydrogenase maturation protease